ncbi:conserved exported hypothetical protein [Rubrivivax sp. A210]|uniref:hypothetical protein n=1 Tax=Rubrivivax sp. A210 TaxID=2772301 RepID=UPI001917EB7C|nr:hypothetical protein [Rubrivivax sp. A210]CAD5374971.1 conserved exported hypothetical protein [Rubrivivax sp. A210]
MKLFKFSICLPFLLALLPGCGGGSSPFDNPKSVDNPAATGGQKLSFVYFMRCVTPVLEQPLRVVINGSVTTNTCASSGCHDNTAGTGGALRLRGGAAAVDPALGAAALRDTDMYKNYYSSLGETVVGSPLQSRLLNKPLVRDVLHGGGLVFETPEDAGAKLLRYWISRPMPTGQDEFSSAANSMFTPADAASGACNTD